MRKTKLNELPQLFNIFLGDMSVIGPRPLHDKQFSFYSFDDQNIIASTMPGLSGVGSIIFRDEEEILSKTKLPLDRFYKIHISPYKGELELWYQKNLSFYTDFMIVLITVYTVFIPNNNLVYSIFKYLPKKPII